MRVIDANTKKVMDFKARVIVLGAGTLDSTRILLNSKSARHPQGLGNSSGLLGAYLSEHHMGPRGSGFIPMRLGTEPTLDDGRPTAPYLPRFRNVTDKHPDFIRGYHFQGGGGAYEYPGMAHDTPGYGKAFKTSVRKHYPALISIGGFGEVLPRKENRVSLDKDVKDAWGIPVLRFDYRFGDNEIKMAKDMADTADEMLRAAGAESIKIDRTMLPPGWSIHEIGTARMGADAKTLRHRQVLPAARRRERVLRGRGAVRLRRHAEHDLVHPRLLLADDGPSEGTDAQRVGLIRWAGACGPWFRPALATRGAGCASLLRSPRMTFFKYGAGTPTPRSS